LAWPWRRWCPGPDPCNGRTREQGFKRHEADWVARRRGEARVLARLPGSPTADVTSPGGGARLPGDSTGADGVIGVPAAALGAPLWLVRAGFDCGPTRPAGGRRLSHGPRSDLQLAGRSSSRPGGGQGRKGALLIARRNIVGWTCQGFAGAAAAAPVKLRGRAELAEALRGGGASAQGAASSSFSERDWGGAEWPLNDPWPAQGLASKSRLPVDRHATASSTDQAGWRSPAGAGSARGDDPGPSAIEKHSNRAHRGNMPLSSGTPEGPR